MANMSSKKDKESQRLAGVGVFERLRRTPYQSMVAVSVVALTLFVIGAVSMFGVGSVVVLKYFETRPQVVGFFKPEIVPTSTQIEDLKRRLMETGKVSTVQYISKEQALEIYKAPFKDDQVLLELATAKMLPATVKVSSTDPKYLGDISDFLKKEQGIYLVDFQKDVVVALTHWTDALRKVGAVLIGIFSLIAFVMIFIVVSFKLALKKEEVEIVSLVGGGRWYIYKPFLTDGIFYGVAGASIAWLTDVLMLLYATPFLVWFLSGIPILPIPWFFYLGLFVGELVIGVGICLMATLVALRRFLTA